MDKPNIELIKAEIIKQVKEPNSIYNTFLTFKEEGGIWFHNVRYFQFSDLGIQYRVERLDSCREILNIDFIDLKSCLAVPFELRIDWSDETVVRKITIIRENIDVVPTNIRLEGMHYEIRVSETGRLSYFCTNDFAYQVILSELLIHSDGTTDLDQILRPNFGLYEYLEPFTATDKFLKEFKDMNFIIDTLNDLKSDFTYQIKEYNNIHWKSLVSVWAKIFKEEYESRLAT